jgi:FkbM family methyltransferase
MDVQKYLTHVSTSSKLSNDHIKYLASLKESGFEPNVIYDVGACVLVWTQAAKELWPNAKYYVFDAFDKAEFLYKQWNLKYHIGVLSDKDDRDVEFYQNDLWPNGNSYYRESGCEYSDNMIKKYKTVRMDTIVQKQKWPKPDLVKIDVQGSELDVVRGAFKTLSETSHLIVEMQHEECNIGAHTVMDTLPQIEQIGFKCIAPKFCNNGPAAFYGFEKTRENLNQRPKKKLFNFLWSFN